MRGLTVHTYPALGVLALPGVALAAARNFTELSNTVVGLIDTATGVLIVAGLVVYFYGIAINVGHFGEEEGWGEKKQGYFFWGIVVLFVMFSIWGIVHLLQNTLFSDSLYHPATGAPALLCDSFGNCS